MKRIILLTTILLLLALPISADWRVTQTEFTVFYRANTPRCARVGEVLQWKIGGNDAQVQWSMVIAAWLKGAVTDLGSGRCEVSWTLDRAWAEQYIPAVLARAGLDVEEMTAQEEADAFSDAFKALLLKFEAEYNTWLRDQAAPAPDPVDDLEDSG